MNKRSKIGSVNYHFQRAKQAIEGKIAALMIKKMHATKKSIQKKYQKQINQQRSLLRKIA